MLSCEYPLGFTSEFQFNSFNHFKGLFSVDIWYRALLAETALSNAPFKFKSLDVPQKWFLELHIHSVS